MPKVVGYVAYLVDTTDFKTKCTTLDTSAIHVVPDHKNQLDRCQTRELHMEIETDVQNFLEMLST